MNKTRVVIAGLLLAVMTVCAAPAAQNPPAATPPANARSARSGGSVSGTVKDSTGGVIPGATITLMNAAGTVATATTDADGTYTVRGIAPGTYSVNVTYSGLAQMKPIVVSVAAGQTVTANPSMNVQEQKAEVTVTDTSADNKISVEASNNATQLVLRKEDLDALPDDPDDLSADLQALAGPSAGPGGNQIYVDGFSGGRLPPKESIREIRINNNPFSAQFDKLGYGRIEILTKPGSDKFHGQGMFNISDDIWNSRNPFLSYNPSFKTEQFGGNVSGPLGKNASFFVDVDRRNIDDNGIITATIPTANLLGTESYQSSVATPQRRTTVSPRVDWQVSKNNTLSLRYEYTPNDKLLAGIGAFNLGAVQFGGLSYASNGYSTSVNEQSFQLVETAVLSAKVVNETHLQFSHQYTGFDSQSAASELVVAQSFTAGGSGYSAPGFAANTDRDNYVELQNYTSVTWGAHVTKFGIRTRSTVLSDNSARNFNGIYQFLGGTNVPYLGAALQPGLTPTTGPNGTPVIANLSSIQQYLTTIRLLQAGNSSARVTSMGYGPSKYSVSAGNPYFGISQTDFGPFIQDDWRVRPNLTISLGMRFEAQTNIPDHSDIAPRVGFAWQPGGANSKAKVVVRGGWGMFYDRFAIASVEQAERYTSGNNLQTYTLNNPTLYDANFSTPLPLGLLSANGNSSQKYQIDPNLRAPYIMQTAIGIEKQLFSRTTLGINFLDARGVHELRTVDINAPLPTVGAAAPGAPNGTAGVRPFASIFPGDIYDYQSTGTYKQTQLLFNVNSQVGRWLTIFSRYSISRAHSDTDGLGTLPSDPYNLRQDWGRASTNVDNTLFLGGSISYKWGIRLSPFIVLRSGQPYNITTGTDLYLQGSGQPTARPSISSTPTQYYAPGLGYLNPDPTVGAQLITRNAATGPGAISINLRLSKTWGFGSTKFAGVSGGARAGGGGGYGGGRGGGGFGGGPPRGMGEGTEHRYNLTLSINARNAINHENLNTPNGSMTSPYFLESTGISGGFGAEATASNQRRIDMGLRFAF
jgi:hypothetical protein